MKLSYIAEWDQDSNLYYAHDVEWIVVWVVDLLQVTYLHGEPDEVITFSSASVVV